MAGFTTAFPTSAKGELPQGLHIYTATTGNLFGCALGIGTPTGTYGAATTNYSNLTGNSDEVSNAGTNYTTGGFLWTAAQNITPATSGTSSYWQWTTNPNWTSSTFNTSGCIIYNRSQSNRAVYVGGFGGIKTITSGTLTLVQPANGAGTSLLQLN
jgi:hypothetical protein